MPVFGYEKHSRGKHEKKMLARMKKPALKILKVSKIGDVLLKKTKIIPKIIRQITSPTRRYSKSMGEAQKDKKRWKLMKDMKVGTEDAAGKVTHSSWVKTHTKMMKDAVGLKKPTKRLNKARQAFNKLMRYQQKQRQKQVKIMGTGMRKAGAQKGLTPEQIEKALPQSFKDLKRISKDKFPKLRHGGWIKYKEPVEIKKVRQAVKKVKSKKGIKKKAVTAATEAVKFTKWPEKLSSPRSKKLGYHVTPTGGGVYFKKTGIDRAGRKTTFKSGKLSVSKKGNEYDALYGRTKYQQRPGYKSIGRRGKDWGTELYKTDRGSGIKFQRTWRFKEGGVVPNKKGEFIAIGCGKVMGNRRKTTKIR
jgi:hypothetical protein